MAQRPTCKLCGKQHWSAEPHDWGAIRSKAEAYTGAERQALEKAADKASVTPRPNPEGRMTKEIEARLSALEKLVGEHRAEELDSSRWAESVILALYEALIGPLGEDEYPTAELIKERIGGAARTAKTAAPGQTKGDRKAYMAEYQRKRREAAKAKAPAEVEF